MMNKLAYAQGVARALKDAGLIKVAMNPLPSGAPGNNEVRTSEDLSELLGQYTPPEVGEHPSPDNPTKAKDQPNASGTQWGTGEDATSNTTLGSSSQNEPELSII